MLRLCITFAPLMDGATSQFALRLGRADAGLYLDHCLSIDLGENPIDIGLKGLNLLFQRIRLLAQIQGVYQLYLVILTEAVGQCRDGIGAGLDVLSKLTVEELLQFL